MHLTGMEKSGMIDAKLKRGGGANGDADNGNGDLGIQAVVAEG